MLLFLDYGVNLEKSYVRFGSVVLMVKKLKVVFANWLEIICADFSSDCGFSVSMDFELIFCYMKAPETSFQRKKRF